MTEKEIKSKVDFLSSAKCNHTPHKYIDITGDLIQGTLLARIMYWFAEDKNKQRKVRIFKDGYFWIAKQRKDWWEEIRISERQYDKAISELKKKGFVVLAKYKFNSMPTIHIRPDYDNINDAAEKWEDELREEIIKEEGEELQEFENGNYIKCNSQGNDTKCKTGITQESNLLTSITNNDYLNRDYNADTTPNSLSNDKDTSNSTSNDVDNLNSPFQEMEMSASKNYKPDRTVKEKIDIETPMPIRAGRIAYQLFGDKEIASNVKGFVDYFLEKRKQKTSKDHIPLKDTTLRKIIHTITDNTDMYYEGKDYYTLCNPLISDFEDDSYKKIVDAYFKQKFKMKVDYSLPHFAQNNILTMLMLKVDKGYWCINEKCGFMEG